MPLFIQCVLVLCILACSTQAVEIKRLFVNSVDVGSTIVALFSVPTEKRTVLNLKDNDGSILLHAEYRANWGEQDHTGKPYVDVLAFNTKNENGHWGKEQLIFEHKAYTPRGDMEFIMKAKDGYFSISVNDEFVITVDYIQAIQSFALLEYYSEGDSIFGFLKVVRSDKHQFVNAPPGTEGANR